MAGGAVYPQINAADTTIPDLSWVFTNDISDPAEYTWDEIVASTPEDWAGFYVVSSGADGHKRGLVIATGSAGSESIFVTLPYEFLHDENVGTNKPVYIPIPISAGTRLSWCWIGATTVTQPAQIMGVKASDVPGDTGLTHLDAGPFDLDIGWPDNLRAVPLTSPASVNTKSAWTELSLSGTNSTPNNIMQGDSLPHQYKYLCVLILVEYVANNTTYHVAFDVGYGAPGSETVVVENQHLKMKPSSPLRSPYSAPIWFPWDRASGDRIAVRFQASDLSNIPPTGELTAIMMGLR